MSVVWPLVKPYSPTGYVNQAGLDTAYVDPLNDLRTRIGNPAVRELADLNGTAVANNAEQGFGSYSAGATYVNDPLGVVTQNLGIFTFAIAGRWEFKATFLWPSVAVGTAAHRRVMYAKKNGARLAYNQGDDSQLVGVAPSGGYAAAYQTTGGEFVTGAGGTDTLQLFAFQNSGASMTVAQAWFMVRLVT